MSLFFYLFTLRSICGIRNLSQQTPMQCLSTIYVVFSNEDKILTKRLYLKRYTAKRLTYEFLSEKSWTKHGVNKCIDNTLNFNLTSQNIYCFTLTFGLGIFAGRLYTIYWVTSYLWLSAVGLVFINLQPEYELPSSTQFV